MTILHLIARALAALNDFIGADEASFEETRRELLDAAPRETEPEIWNDADMPTRCERWQNIRDMWSGKRREAVWTQIINGREYHRPAIETRDDTDPDWTQK